MLKQKIYIFIGSCLTAASTMAHATVEHHEHSSIAQDLNILGVAAAFSVAAALSIGLYKFFKTPTKQAIQENS